MRLLTPRYERIVVSSALPLLLTACGAVVVFQHLTVYLIVLVVMGINCLLLLPILVKYLSAVIEEDTRRGWPPSRKLLYPFRRR